MRRPATAPIAFSDHDDEPHVIHGNGWVLDFKNRGEDGELCAVFELDNGNIDLIPVRLVRFTDWERNT